MWREFTRKSFAVNKDTAVLDGAFYGYFTFEGEGGSTFGLRGLKGDGTAGISASLSQD